VKGREGTGGKAAGAPHMTSFGGGSRNLRKGAGALRSLSLPFSPFPLCLSLPLPLEVGPLKPGRGSGGALHSPGPSSWFKVGSGAKPGQKRIWCTLKLSESHWWQSFLISWVPCFTVERSKN